MGNESVKAIVFDFGGVIGGKSALTTVARYLFPGVRSFDQFLEKFRKERNDYYLGKGSFQSYWGLWSKEFGVPLDPRKTKNLAKHLQQSIPVNRTMLKLVSTLRKNYRIILLSGSFRERTQSIRSEWGHYFDAMYFSDETGWSKPDRAPFQQVLRENRLKAGECVFVDNSIENVRTAKSLGFRTIRFQNARQLARELVRVGVRIKNRN